MAERRMFAKTVIDSDAFLDMPLSTQSLYFHLSMRADDDGFNNNPKKVQRMIGASDDDLKLLILKKFIIPFDNGIIVIKHWKIHNYIRNDRYKETVYQEEKAMLQVKENKSYTLGIPNGYQMDTQVRLGKDSIGKDSIVESISESDEPIPTHAPKSKKTIKHKYGEYQHVLLSDNEFDKLGKDFGEDRRSELIKHLDEYIEMKGYKAKNHNLAIRKWVVEAVEERKYKKQSNNYIQNNQASSKLSSTTQKQMDAYMKKIEDEMNEPVVDDESYYEGLL